MALTDNLISYWKLDESSGNALDAHGSYNLTDTGGVGFDASGRINGARDFEDSSTQYFTITDAAGPNLSPGGSDFTIQAWVKAESITSFPVIVFKGTATSPEYALYVETATANHFVLKMDDGGISASITLDSGVVCNVGTWYLIHAWYTAAMEAGIAINAGSAVTGAFNNLAYNSAGAFSIGASPLQSLYWDGLIDEVGFWTRVLSSGERTQLYAGGTGLAYPFGGGGGGTLMGQILT